MNKTKSNRYYKTKLDMPPGLIKWIREWANESIEEYNACLRLGSSIKALLGEIRLSKKRVGVKRKRRVLNGV